MCVGVPLRKFIQHLDSSHSERERGERMVQGGEGSSVVAVSTTVAAAVIYQGLHELEMIELNNKMLNFGLLDY